MGKESRKPYFVGKHWTRKLSSAFYNYGFMGRFRVTGVKDRWVPFSEFVRRPEVIKELKLSDDDISLTPQPTTGVGITGQAVASCSAPEVA